MKNGFKFEIIHGLEDVDPDDDNIDLVVTLSDGRRFSASVFTMKNIEKLMKKDAETGEALHGKYFFCPDMLIVKNLTHKNIQDTLDDLAKDETLTLLRELED
ncbi:MAG: hypothetical protein V3R64_09955 [Sphingomonadales bacterium]